MKWPHLFERKEPSRSANPQPELNLTEKSPEQIQLETIRNAFQKAIEEQRSINGLKKDLEDLDETKEVSVPEETIQGKNSAIERSLKAIESQQQTIEELVPGAKFEEQTGEDGSTNLVLVANGHTFKETDPLDLAITVHDAVTQLGKTAEQKS